HRRRETQEQPKLVLTKRQLWQLSCRVAKFNVRSPEVERNLARATDEGLSRSRVWDQEPTVVQERQRHQKPTEEVRTKADQRKNTVNGPISIRDQTHAIVSEHVVKYRAPAPQMVTRRVRMTLDVRIPLGLVTVVRNQDGSRHRTWRPHRLRRVIQYNTHQSA